MRNITRGASVAAATAVVLGMTMTSASAVDLGDLCRTNDSAILYTSPDSGIWVPKGRQVRILEWRGPYHYLARYDDTVGQLERSKVNQDTCYQ